MGNSPSKPTEHIFYGETPITFSPSLLSTLQSGTESDSTRQKLQDIHIQKLVQNELERLQKRENDVLAQLSQQELPADDDAASSTKPGILDMIPFVGSKDNGTEELSLSSQTLKERVEGLKSRLGTHFGVKDEPDEVKKARGDVVRCLRIYDRRPLECWKEVQAFRDIGRFRGREFVGDVLGDK